MAKSTPRQPAIAPLEGLGLLPRPANKLPTWVVIAPTPKSRFTFLSKKPSTPFQKTLNPAAQSFAVCAPCAACTEDVTCMSCTEWPMCPEPEECPECARERAEIMAKREAAFAAQAEKEKAACAVESEEDKAACAVESEEDEDDCVDQPEKEDGASSC